MDKIMRRFFLLHLYFFSINVEIMVESVAALYNFFQLFLRDHFGIVIVRKMY